MTDDELLRQADDGDRKYKELCESFGPDANRDDLIRDMADALANIQTAGGDRPFANPAEFLNTLSIRRVWHNCFVNLTNWRVNYLSRDGNWIELEFGEFMKDALNKNFDPPINWNSVNPIIDRLNEDNDRKRVRAKLQEIQNLIPARLKQHRQVETVDVQVDIFSEVPRITIKDRKASLCVPHRPLPFDPTKLNQHVIDDYKQHFPELDEVLEVTLAARFAADRRHAFIWLHADSGWGKGFFVEVLKRLGLVIELSLAEVENAIAGAPVGFSPREGVWAWILFVDEFKYVNSELKQLNNTLTAAPKNQMRASIPMYTKLFASAEGVESLTGEGVEAQFNARFAYLQPKTCGEDLGKRAVFMAVGKVVYLEALTHYAANFLNVGVARFKPMGPADAGREADRIIDRFHVGRKLAAKFGDLSESVDDIASDLKEAIRAYDADCRSGSTSSPRTTGRVSDRMRNWMAAYIKVGYASRVEGGPLVPAGLVTHPTQLVDLFLEERLGSKTRKKLAYKTQSIVSAMHEGFITAGEKQRLYLSKDDEKDNRNRGVTIFEKF
jgi:hypothetical protein